MSKAFDNKLEIVNVVYFENQNIKYISLVNNCIFYNNSKEEKREDERQGRRYKNNEEDSNENSNEEDEYSVRIIY